MGCFTCHVTYWQLWNFPSSEICSSSKIWGMLSDIDLRSGADSHVLSDIASVVEIMRHINLATSCHDRIAYLSNILQVLLVPGSDSTHDLYADEDHWDD